MCHIILFMPIMGLGVFWIWPVEIAGPVYGMILVLSVILYIILVQTMKSPVKSGIKGMLNDRGVVVRSGKTDCLVQVHGELWKAVSQERLSDGERVTVTGHRGLTLKVRRDDVRNNERKGALTHVKS